MNPGYDIRRDHLLTYLREQQSCTVAYIYQAFMPTVLHRIFHYFVCVLPFTDWILHFRGLRDLVQSGGRKLHLSRYRTYLYNPNWAIRMLEKHKTNLLVVDLLKRKHKHIYYELSTAADTLGIRILALNHATQLRDEEASTQRKDRIAKDLSKRFVWMDKFIVHSENDKLAMTVDGVPESKIKVVGSARYCSEWSQTLNTLIPEHEPKAEKSRLRVLIIDGMPVDLDVPAVRQAALKINELNNVDLVVKGIVREGAGILHSLRDKIILDTKTLTLALIRWADVVIATKSSVILEIYNQNKIFVFPKYWSTRPMLFEKFSACWPVNSDEELISALQSIRDENYTLPYGSEQVSNLQSVVIYDGDITKDVLNEYLMEIQNMCELKSLHS
ncbi:hypothetical protein N9H39_06495 [Gammaproteobacteria bacterium]|nr:hypothetical protein [Gammaproteobacteria bacterium]